MEQETNNVQETEIQQETDISQEAEQLQERPYVPRPDWQVWLARIALVGFILFLIMYYTNILRGGR